jgi:hypothetical protein
MPKENGRQTGKLSEFNQYSKIKTFILELTGDTVDEKRSLLMYEIKNQRTYLIKNETSFFIVNDNKNGLTIALKSNIENFIYTIRVNLFNYEIFFKNTKLPMKVSKNLFTSMIELKEKIDSL